MLKEQRAKESDMLNFGRRKTVLFLVIMFLLSVSVAEAKPGNGNGKPGGGGEDPPATSCADKPSVFPAFAYTVIKGGRKSKATNIYLSNADGDCSALIHTAVEVEHLSFRLIGNSGTIAWVQYQDENFSSKDSRSKYDLIKVLRFQVDSKEVTSVDSVETVANSGSDRIYFESTGLSYDGQFVAFIRSDVIVVVQGTYIQDIREIDISICSSNCNQNIIYTTSYPKSLYSLSYSPRNNRVFFSGGINTSSDDERASQAYISFIEKQNGLWSAPRELTYEGNGSYGDNYTGFVTFSELDVALVDFGNSVLSEAVSYRFKNIFTGQRDVHVINTNNCSVADSGDCLSSGESSMEFTIADALLPSLSHDSLLFSSNSSNNIYKYSFSSANLSVVAKGYAADSAD